MRRLPPRPLVGPPAHGPPGPGPMRGMRGPPHPRGGGPRRPGPGIPPLQGLPPPLPIPGAVSSCTNSTDPASMDSRLFVGNLNTVALNKKAVDAIFSQYGIVCGISLHKGFAFVQFRHPDDARWAGASEDGKVYAGQALDINIVSQPKNRSALKRSNSGKGVNDSPAKRTKQDASGTNPSLQRNLVTLSDENEENDMRNNVYKQTAASSRTASNYTDILICGVCKMQFSSLESLTQHKRFPCRLRSTCKCMTSSGDASQKPTHMQCAVCDVEFDDAWALCLHCTEEHQMSIFKTNIKEDSQTDDA